MKVLQIIPHGWPCRLLECPPGLFSYQGTTGFKSEYFASDQENMEVFCVESGECFWGGVSTKQARADLIVNPLSLEWVEV